MLTNLHESLFRVQCYSKIPNNIQFKKELVSAANQHKFCFTMYPIYSLRRAQAVVCLLTLFCIFLILLQLGFTCLYPSPWRCCRVFTSCTVHVQHSGILLVFQSCSLLSAPQHMVVLLQPANYFIMSIDFMPKERQVLLLLNKMTIIMLPYIYINPLLSKSLKILYEIFFSWI